MRFVIYEVIRSTSQINLEGVSEPHLNHRARQEIVSLVDAEAARPGALHVGLLDRVRNVKLLRRNARHHRGRHCRTVLQVLEVSARRRAALHRLGEVTGGGAAPRREQRPRRLGRRRDGREVEGRHWARTGGRAAAEIRVSRQEERAGVGAGGRQRCCGAEADVGGAAEGLWGREREQFTVTAGDNWK